MHFKLAETKEELEAAFALVYQEYVETGIVPPNQVGLRITKYHALPGTAVLIGKWEDEIVCTLSIINDSPMGLPVDSDWDIDFLRKNSTRMAEVSALAIRRGLQGRRGKILLPLCKFMYEYCVLAGIDVLVISTRESVKDFYRAIMLFEVIGSGKPVRYGFANGTPAVAQFLDLRTAPDRFRKVYSARSDKYDLYRFFAEMKFSNFELPLMNPAFCFKPSRQLRGLNTTKSND